MKRLLPVLMGFVVLLLSSTEGWSAEFFKGTPLPEITSLAEKGFAAAQFRLGGMYEKGRGVPQDYKTAVKWYATVLRKWDPLAKQGNVGAQYNLGVMYYNGQGVF